MGGSACEAARVPLITAAVNRFDGSITLLKPWETDVDGNPNPGYRDLFPQEPPAHSVPTCAEAGVLGAMTGFMGTLQAMEAIKLLSGFGEVLVGQLLILDGEVMEWRKLKVPKDPACPVCGVG